MAEFIEFLSKDALSELNKANAELVKMVANVDVVGQKMKGVTTPSGSDGAIKSLTAQYDAQAKVIQNLQQQIQVLNTAKVRQAQVTTNVTRSVGAQTSATREQSVANQILRAETDRSFRATTLLGGAYARASSQLLILKKEAKDAAIAFGEQSKQAIIASKAAQDLDKRIKSADATVGDFQRNVGNYSNAFTKGISGAFSAVRQLAYLLPGIGIAGILGFAVEPLFNYIKGLVGVKEATEAEKKALEDKVKVQQEASSKLAGLQSDEISKSKILLENAKNLSLPYKERLKAVNELQQRYPEYLGNLSKEQILAGNTALAEEQLNDALIKRGIALASQQLIQEAINDKLKNQKLLADKLNDVYSERAKLGKELQKYDPFSKDETYKEKYNNITNRLENLSYLEGTLKGQYKDKNKLLEESIKYYVQQYNANAKYIGIVKEETKETDKNKKEKIKLTFNEVKSEYELKIAILERQKVEANDRASNESSSLDDRLKARKEFSKKSIEILDLELQKTKAINSEKEFDNIIKNNLARKNGELTFEEWQKNLNDILDRGINERQTSDTFRL